MGTRSITVIQDESGSFVANMYLQFDGYPSYHGVNLGVFLKPFTIVNGFTGQELEPAANGMGCLAAQLISHFKEGIGGCYLYPPKERDCGQDYSYFITLKGQVKLQIKVMSYGKTLFTGPINQKFIDWCKKQD